MATTLTKEDETILTRMLQKMTGRSQEWVVGVANDAAWRLFIEHRATRNADDWVYDKPTSPEAASAIEAHLRSLGAKSYGGTGDEVFAYHPVDSGST